MSGAEPRTARPSQEGGLRARGQAGRLGGARGRRARLGGRASRSRWGARSRRARPRASPSPLPSPNPGPPPFGYLICMPPGLASVRAPGREAGVREGWGRGGPCLPAARARPHPSEWTPRPRRPRPARLGPRGTKGTRWVLRAGHVPVGRPLLRTRRSRWPRAGKNYRTNTSYKQKYRPPTKDPAG